MSSRSAASMRAYRAANPEKSKAYSKAYNAAYYAANRDRILAHKKVVVQDRTDEKKASRRAYHKAYRTRKAELCRQLSLAHKRKKRGASNPTRAEPLNCEICGNPPTGLRKHLHEDHDHVTGLFRGWLCLKCNSGIGMLQDDVVVVRKAVSYLECATHG